MPTGEARGERVSQRSVGLDVIRAACVAGVVATHFSPFFFPAEGIGALMRNGLSLGSFGVTGFFLLSAYLLMGILLKEVGTGQKQVWKRYWIRRSLRIWPLYFLAILVVIVVSLITATPVSGLPWLATFTYNWVSWREPSLFLSHFWSMGAEEQLYVLIPILAFVAFKWRWPIIVALIAIAPVSRLFVSEHFPYPAVWNFTTSHLDVFAIGILIASLDYNQSLPWLRVRAVIASSRWVAGGVGVLALVLAGAAVLNPQWVFGSAAASWTYLAVALVWTWLLVKLTQRPRTEIGAPTRAAVWMGQRSYGIYVYHWPAAVLGTWLVTSTAIPAPLVGVVLIAVVLAFSEVSFRWIESPFLRLKSRFSRVDAPIAEKSAP
ncbi:acyltransferase [Leifsonia sp. H3M29-4]|uniref:acyltransferase family protein n=1 Tax=Salinibacterium metalliresistens TaxID=3031321 RepID=UPI0023DC42BC|nr:acyltransferase [Salinibacterium metalliresistens]MDF1479167.1 acyltransferase [Salinibacterium metalliresistens]